MKEFKIESKNSDSDIQADLNNFFSNCNQLITVDIANDILSIKVCKDENEYNYYCGNISEQEFLNQKIKD